MRPAILLLFIVTTLCQKGFALPPPIGALKMLDESANEVAVMADMGTAAQDWTFDIGQLSSEAQEIFNTEKPISEEGLDRLERELLHLCSGQQRMLIERVIDRARLYVTGGFNHRANALLRGFASKVNAVGLTELVLTRKEVYESPLNSVELPIIPGGTIRVGWPISEVYIGSSDNYKKDGPLEGYEPLLVDTRILAMTNAPLAGKLFPVLGTASSLLQSAISTSNIAKTVSAPVIARYLAYERAGITQEQFNEHFEEEVIPQYRIPGTNLAYRVTYRLKNKGTGQVFDSSYSVGDVLSIASVVTKAANSVKLTQTGQFASNAMDMYQDIESIVAPLTGGE